MDLHGNNKEVKEKEKKPHPEIKWVCETGELTRERVLGGKMRRAGRGWRESLGVCYLQQGMLQWFYSDVHKQSFAVQGKSL